MLPSALTTQTLTPPVPEALTLTASSTGAAYEEDWLLDFLSVFTLYRVLADRMVRLAQLFAKRKQDVGQTGNSALGGLFHWILHVAIESGTAHLRLRPRVTTSSV